MHVSTRDAVTAPSLEVRQLRAPPFTTQYQWTVLTKPCALRKASGSKYAWPINTSCKARPSLIIFMSTDFGLAAAISARSAGAGEPSLADAPATMLSGAGPIAGVFRRICIAVFPRSRASHGRRVGLRELANAA